MQYTRGTYCYKCNRLYCDEYTAESARTSGERYKDQLRHLHQYTATTHHWPLNQYGYLQRIRQGGTWLCQDNQGVHEYKGK